MNRTRNALTGEIRNFHAGGDRCMPACWPRGAYMLTAAGCKNLGLTLSKNLVLTLAKNLPLTLPAGNADLLTTPGY